MLSNDPTNPQNDPPEPSEKSPAMAEDLDTLTAHLFGKTRRGAIEKHECVSCDAANVEFRDTTSFREYSISGLCQKCQDTVFGS